MRENIIQHRHPVCNLNPVCNLIKSEQTTSYHTGDDGDLELGISHDYEIFTTGQHAGATNITINGKTHALSNNCVRDNAARINTDSALVWARYVPLADIGPAEDGRLFWEQYTVTDTCTFNSGAKTIAADAGTPFDVNALCVGRKIETDSVLNPGPFTVAAIANNLVTVNEAVADEASVSITISTIDDLIWNFLGEANANGLGGYTDWRIPNRRELESIANIENCNPSIDTSTFPSTPSTYFWTSSTHPCYSAYAWYVYFYNGVVSCSSKRTHKDYVRLVRG